MKNFTLFILLFTQGSLLIAAEINPLTRLGYGQEWQTNEKFKYCGPSKYEFKFTKTELELAWIINLAKEDPKLFIKNVISKELAAFKNSPRLLNIIKKEYTKPKMNKTQLIATYKFIAHYQNDSVMLNTIDNVTRLKRVESNLLSPSLIKGSFTITKSNPVKYIISALSQPGPIGDAFQKIIFSEMNYMGFCITPLKQTDKIHIEFAADSVKKEITKFSYFPDFDFVNWRENKVIAWGGDNDPILKKYANSNDTIDYHEGQYVTISMVMKDAYVEPHKFFRISDSLYGDLISHREIDIFVDTDIKYSADKSRADTIYESSANIFSSGLSCQGADSTMNIYTLYRIQDYKNSINSTIYIRRIFCKKDEYLPPDSIISENDIDTTSFYRIDSYANNINNNDLPTLVDILTKPYKKDWHKIRSIYSWIVSHISYDYEGLKNNNGIQHYHEAFKYRKAVCGGISDLLSEMARLAKLNCTDITGMARAGLNSYGVHAWNLFRIDGPHDNKRMKGKYFLVDPTWKIFCPNPVEFSKHHYARLKFESLLQHRSSYEEWKK